MSVPCASRMRHDLIPIMLRLVRTFGRHADAVVPHGEIADADFGKNFPLVRQKLPSPHRMGRTGGTRCSTLSAFIGVNQRFNSLRALRSISAESLSCGSCVSRLKRKMANGFP